MAAQLTLAVSAAVGPYDLDALGPLDWFVYPGSATQVKKNGPAYLTVARNPVANGVVMTDNPFTGGAQLTWAGGTPTASGSTTGGIATYSGALNPKESGYTVTAPADTTLRTLRIFASSVNASLNVKVTISDGSSPAITYDAETFVQGGGGKYNVLEVQFAAASAGQKVTVTTSMPISGASRTNGIQGAALTGAAPASGAVTVSGVTVTPATATLAPGATQQFAATVAGANSPPQGVKWTASAGTITAAGLFTAPAATSVQQNITITATSDQDASKSGTAVATVAASVLVLRTVTIALDLDKDVPAVSLTGAMVAFYDEKTPDKFGTPRFQSASETTDVNGVLTFTCQSTLAVGDSGGFVVRFANGKHFNGLALVS